MKRLTILFTVLISLFILSLNCSPSDNMSVLTVFNKSNITVTNVKIGTTIIAPFIFPGGRVDYYIFSTLTGTFSSAEAKSAKYTSNYTNNKLGIIETPGNYELRSGTYYFESEIFQKNDIYYITLKCEKSDYNWGSDDADDYADGDFYLGD